jgi:hypothetical protein
MVELAEWDSFYLIVGAAAGALIGLQFVVMTLIAGRPDRSVSDAGSAFATPTIVHFGSVLLLAAVVRAPWQTVTYAAVFWGLMGLVGFVYVFNVTRKMQAQTLYKPEFEDWLCHSFLPLSAYAILLVSALTSWSAPRGSLFGVGGAALLLLFAGIHNAWDGVAYHVFVRKEVSADTVNDGTDCERENDR